MSGEDTVEHFRAHGWMRVAQAFGADAAARMRDAVWRALEPAGIRRDRPETWTIVRPERLQHLKKDPAFQGVGSAALLQAIASILGPFDAPKDWGAAFVAFPCAGAWTVPAGGWHIDANYTSTLWPPGGVKTFALFGDVEPRGGGTLVVSGSHRLVHDWFQKRPPPPGARSAEHRRLLRAHPFVRDLHITGSVEERVARFMARAETIDGVSLRVVETVGAAGDVFLLHPLVLHVAASNNAAQPRFLLSGGVTTDMWGWA